MSLVRHRASLLGFCVLAVGCTQPISGLPDSSAPTADARDMRDATRDAAEPDEGAPPTEAGIDAGEDDAAVPEDAGRDDAFVLDAEPRDADPIDADRPDEGPLDGGPDMSDPCAMLMCPMGRVCRMGVCELDDECDPDCPATLACVAGTCVSLDSDNDGDGVTLAEMDCDDTDRLVYPGAPERCNAVDDDCDLTADEGNPGGGGTCDTGEDGLCGPGTFQCRTGSVVCVRNRGPAPEVCNGEDDNCDGSDDEGDPGGGGACDTGLMGVCAAGVRQCSGGAIVCMQTTTASPEMCNGMDDDCDGTNDDGNPGGGMSCMTGMPGICGPGTSACAGGSISCVRTVMPVAETCNGLDDNCDGTADNLPRLEMVTTTFAALTAAFPPCTGTGSLFGDCRTAVHRFCQNRDGAGRYGMCTTSGVGPIVNAGSVIVGCVRGGTRVDTTFAELSAHNPVCDDDTDSHGYHCLNASNSECRERGFASGFGPVEHSLGTAQIACLPIMGGFTSEVGDLQTAFTAFDSGCPSTPPGAVSYPCNRAIHLYCAARPPYVTGFGSTAFTGTGMAAQCVAP